MKLTPLSVLVDETWGPVGSPERDEMEAQLQEDVNAYFLGDAIKKARRAKNMTQQELGERVGVQKSQISKLENGKSIITLPTISRIFRALGVKTAALDLGSLGRVALW